MERVPQDPLAGPVAKKENAPHKLAVASGQKPAQKPAAPVPSLRTASDLN
jgi:hypothetical protein